MGWTSPATWVAAAQLTAAQLNAQLRDNLLELNGTASAWTAYVPTLTSIPATITEARYKQIAKTTHVEVVLTLTGAPTGAFAVSMPFPSRALVGGVGVRAVGVASGLRVAVALRTATVVLISTTVVNFLDSSTSATWAAAAPFAWASGDSLGLAVTYEAA